MYELKTITQFGAAHQLRNFGGKCENLHGHNWKIETYVKGKSLDKAGLLIDFHDIKKEVKRIKEILGPNLVVSPSHEALLPNVPPENVLAMAEASSQS